MRKSVLLLVAMALLLCVHAGCAGGNQQEVGSEEDPDEKYLSVCTRAEDQQEASNEELNGKIAFLSRIYTNSSANISAGADATAGQESSAAPVMFSTDNEVCVMNADGTGVTRLTDTPESEGTPTWLPDGSKIAFTREDPTSAAAGEVYVMNADGSNQVKLPWPSGPRPTASTVYARDLEWSPDGARIAFQADCAIYIMPADGSGTSRRLTSSADWACASSPTWSPNGEQIAFFGEPNPDPGGARNPGDIYAMNISREGDQNQWRQLTRDSASNVGPSWSPDGTEIAFVQWTGTSDIHKIDGNSLKQTRLTDGPGTEGYPTWSPDGRKIAFVSDGGLQVMNADGSDPTPVLEVEGVLALAPDWQPLP